MLHNMTNVWERVMLQSRGRPGRKGSEKDKGEERQLGSRVKCGWAPCLMDIRRTEFCAQLGICQESSDLE